MSWAVDWAAAAMLVTAGYAVGMVTGWWAGSSTARRRLEALGERRAHRHR